ncbi:MAG: M17 family metallopeptidase [Woeseiaceae bacterium]
MQSLLEKYRQTTPPKVTQATGRPDARSLAGIDQLLLILPGRIPAALWRKIPQGNKVQALMRRSNADAVPAVATRINNKRQSALYVGKADSRDSEFELLVFARKMVAAATSGKAGTVGIWVAGFDTETQERLVKHMTAAALAAAFIMPSFKSKETPARIRAIRILGLDNKIDLARVSAEAEGNNMARWLTALPPNKLDAANYAVFLKELAAENGWQFKKFGVDALKKMGAGAFLAVAQGNEDKSASIVRLRYRPGSNSASPALTLVGKGIIFDTGGTNLKPFTSMLDMHIDMGGSAVAVGTLLSVTQLETEHPVDCWLAITENRTGPSAYKSQDVITAFNGKTIQTIHTDAEGRMALADTLALACEDSPTVIIDYATLTGACVSAVTTRYSGVFTNNPDLHPVLKKSGRDSGERVWPFPIGKEFLDDLKSDTADLMQCSPSAGGDHILAASFLQEFVDDKSTWVHVDLSACSRKGGLAHIPTEITGFGVRFTMNLLIDKNIVGLAGQD